MSEEDIPKMSSNKEKINEKLFPESIMKLRIRNYLRENFDKEYINYKDMAKSLHAKFPEYTLIQFKVRVRPRFFDQVGHQTTDASIENKYFFTKKCHHQTYQNYEQSQQKLGTFLVNKVL